MPESKSSKPNFQFQDITGQSFGRLTAVERVGSTKNGTPLWKFACQCGKTIIRQAGSIKSGAARSCGCLRREIHLAKITKHGESRSKEYGAWSNLIKRCHDPKNPRYKTYGARGITVCDRWRDSFENFLADMGKAPSPDMSIERIRNDEGYGPGNCCWIPRARQAINKTTNHILTLNGESLPAAEWGRRTGIPAMTILARLRRGWSEERALTTPVCR